MTVENPIRITPGDALLIVDVQNDFCAGGALAVPDADDVVPALNSVIPAFETVITTQDWHPREHCSFQTNGGPWPVHCVQDSPGAHLHSALEAETAMLKILKGTDPDREAYSGFEGDPDLANFLRDHNIERVFIGGLATDVCVRATALDALRNGFQVVLLTNACRGVKEEDSEQALREMQGAGAEIAETRQVSTLEQ